MTFLGESINILKHRVQKIGQKSCTQNRNFEQRAQRHSNHRLVSLETVSYVTVLWVVGEY